MDKVRRQIREIDAKMIALISKRMNLSKKLGKLKKEKNLPIRDKKRETLLFKQWRASALACGVSYKCVKKLWKLILNESIKIQNRL